MAAVQLMGHGGLEQLVYSTQVPVPRPSDGEVLIEVSACGMNNTDVWVREGAYGTERDPQAIASWRSGPSTLVFPRIQGADSVGYIVAVGPGVEPERVGERVILDFSLYNTPSDSLANIDYIGHGRDGGYAEYLCAPVQNAHRIRSSLTDAELATFCCAYLTGEHMLDRASVRKGERVLITGASGGVGSGLIQLCRVRGAIPYAVTSRSKVAQVMSVGAEAVVVRDEGDLVAAVAAATQRQPIDVVADLVAGPMFNDLLAILRPEGRYTTAGAIGGPLVQLDLRRVYLKHLQIHGSSQGTRAEFARIVSYIETGRLRALLDGIYRLSDFRAAQRAFIEKSFTGKLVIVPDKKWSEVGASHPHLVCEVG